MAAVALWMMIVILPISHGKTEVDDLKDRLARRNISDVFKGSWHPVRNSTGFLLSNYQTRGIPLLRRSEGTVLFAFETARQKSRWKEDPVVVDAVRGQFHLRDGHYALDSDYSFVVRGVFDQKESIVAFIAHSSERKMKQLERLMSWNSLHDVFQGFQAIQDGNVSVIDFIRSTDDETEESDDSSSSPNPNCWLIGRLAFDGELIHRSGEEDLFGKESTVLKWRFDGVVESPECGFSLSLKGDSFFFDVLFRRAIAYTSVVILTCVVQILALIRQMNYSQSHAAATRISLISAAQMTILDSYLCLFDLTVGVVVGPIFHYFAAAAFLQFLLFSVFEMQYVLAVWKAQNGQTLNAGGGEAMRRELSLLYMRFYAGLLLGLFLLFRVRATLPFVLVILYGFWIPQIWHSVAHNARRPVDPLYVVALGLGKIVAPLYFSLYEDNFLGLQPSPAFALFLTCWMALQCVFVLLQHKFGPRFFIPPFLQPRKYNYFHPLDGAAVASTAAAEGTTDPEANRLQCVICLSPVEAAQGQYMVAPCNHIFHVECLSRWMEIKMECPICRHALPEI